MRSDSLLRRPFRYEFRHLTYWLVGINVAVFLLTAFSDKLFYLLSLNVSDVLERGYIWQVFTYMFVHDNTGIMHILFNMIGLWIFGIEIERRVGSREFLLFYLLTGTLCGIFSLAVFALLGQTGGPLVGASGAIFGLLLLFAVFFPDAKVLIWGILPMRAPVMVIVFGALEILLELLRASGHPLDNIAHLTHLAGFGFAWLYCRVRYGIDPWKRFFLK